MTAEETRKGEPPPKYRRAKRIAVAGALLVVIVYCSAVVVFTVGGRIVYPTDDFNLLVTFPPWPADKFWYTTFGGRNHEVKTVADVKRVLRERVERNNGKYGPDWRFKRISIVGHGGPGALIFERRRSLFTIDDIHVFGVIREHTDADTEIVIRSCSMLHEKKGFDFIKHLAETANCAVTAWSDVGMYNGLVQLGDAHTAYPDGGVRRRE